MGKRVNGLLEEEMRRWSTHAGGVSGAEVAIGTIGRFATDVQTSRRSCVCLPHCPPRLAPFALLHHLTPVTSGPHP